MVCVQSTTRTRIHKESTHTEAVKSAPSHLEKIRAVFLVVLEELLALAGVEIVSTAAGPAMPAPSVFRLVLRCLEQQQHRRLPSPVREHAERGQKTLSGGI